VETSYEFLKTLDEKRSTDGSFNLLITLGFGMRGVDYRAPLTGITLVIALSFNHEREATQALARVGRYKEPCARYLVEGVELVDELKCAAYVAGLIAGSNSNARVQALIPPQANKATKAPKPATNKPKKAKRKALAPPVEKNNGSTMPLTRQSMLIYPGAPKDKKKEEESLRN
jgi:hypothetical protein